LENVGSIGVTAIGSNNGSEMSFSSSDDIVRFRPFVPGIS